MAHCTPGRCWLSDEWTHCLLDFGSVRAWGPLHCLICTWALSGIVASWLKSSSVFRLDSSMVPTTSQRWILVASPASTIHGCPCPSTEHMGPSVLPYYTKAKGVTKSLDSVFLSAYPCFPQLTLCWVAPSWKLGSTGQDGPKQEVENNSLNAYLLQNLTPEKWVKAHISWSLILLSLTVVFLPWYSGLERSARFFLPSSIFFTLSFLSYSQHKNLVYKLKILLWNWEFPFLHSPRLNFWVFYLQKSYKSALKLKAKKCVLSSWSFPSPSHTGSVILMLSCGTG